MVLVTGAAVGTVASFSPAVALFGQAGAAAAAGAIIPAAANAAGTAGAAGATVAALGEGALVGLGALAGGGSSGAGIALAALAGPIGCAVVGCNKDEDDEENGNHTWDCWKLVVRDMSPEPSRGITLRSLAAHPNVQNLSLECEGLFIDNKFGERFRLLPVEVEGTLALHVSVLSS